MFEAHCNKVRGGKWFVSGEQFVGNATKSILVTFFTHHASELLGSHIGWSPNDGTPFDTGAGENGGNTEVGQECFPLSIEEDIFWRKMTMDDVRGMGILQRVTNV